MNVDPGIVYILLSALLATQAWALKEIIGLKSRMHRMEASDQYIKQHIDNIENRLDKQDNRIDKLIKDNRDQGA